MKTDTPHKNAKKLNAIHKKAVIYMLAYGFSPGLIVQELYQEFGIKVTPDNIRIGYLYRPKTKKRIEEIREKIDQSIMEHPLSKKVNRLNYILKALNHSLEFGVTKKYFSKTGEYLGDIEEVQVGVVSQLIREARAEVEGESDSGKDVKLTLLQVIQDWGKVHERRSKDKHQHTRGDLGGVAGLGPDESAQVDQSEFGNIEIL